MSTPHYSYVPIATQPAPRSQLPTSPSLESLNKDSKGFVDSNSCGHDHGKRQCDTQSQEDFESGHNGGHRHCHNGRIKQFLLPIFIISFGLIFIGLVGCVMSGGMGSGAANSWSVGDIFSRAVADGTNGNQNTFMSKKLYLIIIFVGLVLVVIAAIMLSAWCCRGAFQNPLCCPCYLCACCGGLACLECIGCGLCAEGVSEM